MLQSKYLTEDGLTSWFKKCYNLGFKYVFYNPDNGICMLSEREPVFRDTTFMYCDGKKYPMVSYFSTLVAKELLKDRNYIAIEDHIDIVDWENVPVDTKVIVSHSTGSPDYYRYFAEYKDGKVYAWDYGATSWSSDAKSKSWWEYAKLVK
jgi:hypothetical protein